jgi:hypothetical protein
MGKINMNASAESGDATSSVSLWSDIVTMKFDDKTGKEYVLTVEDNGETIDIVLAYPDGDRIALESIIAI